MKKIKESCMDPIIYGVLEKTVWSILKRIILIPTAKLIRGLQAKSPFKPIVLCLKHRINAREFYYEKAFSSGKDVLLITIMSHTTIKEDMVDYLKVANESRTRLRILSWAPSEDSTIEAFRRHLNENNDNQQRTIEQVKQAIVDWESLEKKYNNIEHKKYLSSPTMQGMIVDKECAVIELIPYDTRPKDRPALILTPKTDPVVFEFFRERFEKLWNDAV